MNLWIPAFLLPGEDDKLSMLFIPNYFESSPFIISFYIYMILGMAILQSFFYALLYQ